MPNPSCQELQRRMGRIYKLPPKMKSSEIGNLGTQQGIYDPHCNLIYYYIYSQETQGFFYKEVDTNFQHVPNIAIWDIPKKTKFLLFQDGFLGQSSIRSIYFEQVYDADKNAILLNNNRRCLNNNCLVEREPKNKLLIETYQPRDKRITLWTCDKWGNGLKKLGQFHFNVQWHIDIYNESIRIMEHRGNDIQVTEFSW